MSKKIKPKLEPGIPDEIHRAALRLGCRPADLLSWRMENSEVVVIAPDGKKWRFQEQSLSTQISSGGTEEINEHDTGLFA